MLEDEPSDTSIIRVEMDLSMNLCTEGSGLTTCCPTGFTSVGFDEDGALICLGG